MRSLILVVAILVVPISGCSLFIANTGKDIALIGSQEDAHNELGKPVASGTDKGLTYEDFSYHGKVYRREEAWAAKVGFVMTFGLGEIILFPAALGDLGLALISGEDIRLYYNDRCRVTMCRLNGRLLWGDDLTPPNSKPVLPDLPPVALDLMFTLIP